MLKKILGGICCFLAIGGVLAIASDTSTESATVNIGISIFFIIIAILFFTSDKRKEKRQRRKEDWYASYNEAIKTCTMKHINGLPIAENMDCKITAMDDKFMFSSGTMNFELEKSKITDMCIRTDQEIEEQYVSSIGGAVGGAVLFGPLGAMIGGRAKKKTVKNEIHNYLIITYQSPDIKYIGFEIDRSLASAEAYVNDFKNRNVIAGTYQL
ncbi:hypothetical protein IMSAGC011_01091 [Lachnospiraceae bacterium]|nr:hypothetical protein IMSAGC011_01091 [Lachnospiraceae bacterium]